MTYTLLGAPTLGFDLVRSGEGGRVASLLLTCLAVGESDLPRLAAAHPGRVRRSRWSQTLAQSAGARKDLRNAMFGSAGGDRVVDLGNGNPDAARLLLRQLEVCRLGDLESLERLVRREILDWTWSSASPAGGDGSPVATQTYLAALAADVLVDAVAAAYADDAIDVSLHTQLVEPLRSTRMELRDGQPLDLPEPTSAILAQLASCDPQRRGAIMAAVDAYRHETAQWAPAMHEATWAVELSGRCRTAAAAQFLAVKTFGECGFSGRDAAYGAWNLVSGVVAASVVTDLLSSEHLETLTRAWSVAWGKTPDWA